MITLHRNMRVLFTGDSITESRVWFNPVGGLVDQLSGALGPIPNKVGPGFVATDSAAVTTKARGQSFYLINTGVNGNQTADLLAGVQSRIIAFAPDVCIIECGVNDINGGAGSAAAIANMTSIVQAVQAALPACQIGITGIVIFGEAWVPGPAWGPGNGPADA